MKRRPMTAAERREVSRRMKAYWAARRAGTVARRRARAAGPRFDDRSQYLRYALAGAALVLREAQETAAQAKAFLSKARA
jgi:hypothetical protein